MLDTVPIRLNYLFKFNARDLVKYKLHLAAYNGKEHPLDVFNDNFEEWMYWNEWRDGKDDFPREYIFSLIPIKYKVDKYLFGGIFKIIERYNDWEKTKQGYKIELVEEYMPYIGRVEVDFHRYTGLRGRAFKLENFIENMTISQIYERVYDGIEFPGYDSICIDFTELCNIITNNKQDWKVALQNQKGIYVIVDKRNGKKYVGSAYGEGGIWARWQTYVQSNGHGNNDELYELITKYGHNYAKENFIFSVIELMSMSTDSDYIIQRENHWKNVLQTKGKFGYNKN